jgi:putative hydrolase of the HAD superfamily
MKALIFDLAETLVADEVSATTAFLKACLFAQAHYGINMPGFHATIREVCRSFWHQSPAREYCMEIGISSWEGLWAEFSGADENLRILREWAPTYRRLSWATTLKKFGIDDEAFAMKLADKYITSRQELHVVFRDVAPTLEKFKSCYRLGLLTNGAPDLQRRKIHATDLGKYFDAVVVSGEVGIGKPDARIFEKMLAQLKTGPESALVVGDSLKSDIAGAQGAGIKAVWVNRSENAADAPIIPDGMVYSLDELGKVIRKVEQAVKFDREYSFVRR